MTPNAPESRRTGVLYGLAAYGWWGLAVIYFKAVAHVPPLEVLAQRVVWSVPLLFGLLALRGRLGEVRAVLRDRRTLAILFLTTLLIGSNWLIYITAVTTGHILQSSLGYYINPLVNVMLGMAALGERLRPAQWASVLLAAAGVLYLAFSYGRPPWFALSLAATFALYGLLRKTVRAEGSVGLTVETSLMLPAALVFLLVQATQGRPAFGHVSLQTDLLLLASGLMTAMPLVWFANAIRRLPLTTMGFLQYLSPTLQFLLAVAVYGEPFTRAHLVTFGCIWAALALYSVDAALAARRTRGLP
ncbi:MAG TPA: EamA family transporter RarD [Thermoanaerobaculia bacterium]|nr:EamA family transporter RarD [Thermoanaerobaculia bacterium]